jgi:transcriptional regulator with XRE-family HTH domain
VQPGKSSSEVIVERVKAILQSKGMILHQISQTSGEVFGKSSPYFLPHNLYYDLGLESFSPSLHQIFALSKLSGYQFNDWLRVFGFPPEEITRQQILLRSKRTLLIDTSLEDPEGWIPWFQEKPEVMHIEEPVPLGRILRKSDSLRAVSFAADNRFLYAKVGNEDTFAFPNLLPGSIVRGDTHYRGGSVPSDFPEIQRPLFIAEHSHGVCCCRLQMNGERRRVLVSSNLPYAQVELKLGEEAKILGIIDLEIRPLLTPEQPDIPAQLARRWRPLKLSQEEPKLSTLIRQARNKMGWSFRAASAISRQIAEQLGDRQFFAAPSSLSDFEAVDTPPRHIQKVLTLCIVYGLHLRTFLKSAGIDWNESGMEPIPDALVPRKPPCETRATAEDGIHAEGAFLPSLMKKSEEVPIFMRYALANISGLKHPKLNDFFWSSLRSHSLHWLFRKDCLLMVNRQKKRPSYSRMKASWQQPIYLLLKRDGTYVCACCSLEDDLLVIHPQVESPRREIELRNHDDAEVVGQIVCVCRRM